MNPQGKGRGRGMFGRGYGCKKDVLILCVFHLRFSCLLIMVPGLSILWKQCFLVRLPSRNMAGKQCFLVRLALENITNNVSFAGKLTSYIPLNL